MNNEQREAWVEGLQKELKRLGFGGLARIEINRIARDAMAVADQTRQEDGVKAICPSCKLPCFFTDGRSRCCDAPAPIATPALRELVLEVFKEDIERANDGEGDPVYVHRQDCGVFCDYACQGKLGHDLAKILSATPPVEPPASPDLRAMLERAIPLVSGANRTWHKQAQAALAADPPVVDEVVTFDSIVSEQRDIRFLYKGPTLTVQTRLEGDRLRVMAWKEDSR